MYKSAKQKLFKETSMTNYPEYAAEISSQILTDKRTITNHDKVFKKKNRKRKRPISSWMATERSAGIHQRTSLFYNETNYKWNTSEHSMDTEDKNEFYLPTTRSYFDKMTTQKDEWTTLKSSTDIGNYNEQYVPTRYSFSNAKEHRWNSDEHSTTIGHQNGHYSPTSDKYPSSNPSVLVLERESAFNKMLEQMEGEVQLLRIYLQEDPGTSTYADTVGPSTVDGVNKIVKDYWYL